MQDTLISNQKEKKREYDIEYRAKNKLKLSEQWKLYDQNNKVEVRARKRKYVKQRQANDPLFRIKHNISKSINQMLKSNSSSKKGKSFLKALPYPIQELKKHLEKQFEPWMTWNNQGKYNSKTWDDNNSFTWTWQIDHIIPHSAFLYTTMTSQCFNDCWALCNLRPLSVKQNLMDGVNRVRHNLDGKND
ncbi:MAG: hypothetical protein ACREBJ_00195 [Nitrosotalea sp.]